MKYLLFILLLFSNPALANPNIVVCNNFKGQGGRYINNKITWARETISTPIIYSINYQTQTAKDNDGQEYIVIPEKETITLLLHSKTVDLITQIYKKQKKATIMKSTNWSFFKTLSNDTPDFVVWSMIGKCEFY